MPLTPGYNGNSTQQKIKMFRKMSTNTYYEVSTSWNSNTPNSMDNLTNATIPEDLRFNQNTLTVVLVYSVLFLIAAVGNLTVFISLFRSRHRKSRISLMIRHLAIADLVVTFIMIPIEISWRITVQWIAGNVACKAFLFLRAFGLYLSSNVLVCVSLDRYFAVLHPLKVNDARRRGKFMLACAWGISLLYSVPQSIVFHVSPHPDFPYFMQCVTFGSFSSRSHEVAYNLFCVIAMYFVPLLVIIVAYTAIMCEISNKSNENKGETYQTSNGRMRLRRSDISNIERARSRTLRMTITIVLVFVWCWTPYVVMTLWYMFDEVSAKKVPNWLQNALFMMAVSNSCMNPVVYGSYAINFRKEFCKCLSCFSGGDSRNDVPNGDASRKPGQGGIARRVIKCVLTLQKVRSGTRSTAVMHGPTTVVRSPTRGSQMPSKLPNKRLSCHLERSPSMGRISFLSEPRRMRSSVRCNFHSEPLPCCINPTSAAGVCSHSSAELSSSVPETL